MRLTQLELGAVGLLIAYIAFGAKAAPSHIKDFLSSSVGKIVALLSVLYVTVYKSLIVGVFLALALVFTIGNVTEYLDAKEQTPVPPTKQPTSSGVPAPSANSVIASLLNKGDRMPMTSTKKGTPAAKPKVKMESVKPTPQNPKAVEHFAGF